MWLIAIILAYLFFSLSSLGDKLILSGKPKPKAYTFYVGLIGLSVFLFIPFMELRLPSKGLLIWIIAEAIIYLLALYTMFSAVKKFEISKVAVTIGAVQPIFIFILTWFVWKDQRMSAIHILAFILLLIGSIIISLEKNYQSTKGYLKITLFTAFLFSVDYVLMKFIFLTEPFLLGLFWMRIIAVLFALVLLLSKNTRHEIFSKQSFLNKKIISLMAFTYTAGGAANILQAFAISLTPVALLPILNSLRGMQYIFLFLITLFFSIFFPKILKEEISKRIIFQKITAIILIAGGLAILVY
jgi:drug/metabolite transporter (DMT)-like permease